MENMKYAWMSAGKTSRWFYSKEDLYADVHREVFEQIRQDTGNSKVEVNICFDAERITARIREKEYAFKVVATETKAYYLGHLWDVIDAFEENDEWWFVSIIPDEYEQGTYADMWMNSCTGQITLIRPNGQTLQRYC